MTTGQKVKALRKEKGLTQEELAHMLGYKNKTSVAHIETNRDIPIDMIAKIAHIFGTSPAYLMGWERNPKLVCELHHSLDMITDEQFDTLLSIIDGMIADNSEPPVV